MAVLPSYCKDPEGNLIELQSWSPGDFDSRGGPSADDNGPNVRRESPDALGKGRSLVVEVDHESIASGSDVFGESLCDPARWPYDRVPTSLVGAIPIGLIAEERAQAQHDAPIRAPLAESHRQVGHLARPKGHRMPDTAPDSPP